MTHSVQPKKKIMHVFNQLRDKILFEEVEVELELGEQVLFPWWNFMDRHSFLWNNIDKVVAILKIIFHFDDYLRMSTI